MELKDCKLCPEREYGNGPVPGCGDLCVQFCLLGRNPGRSEDSLGRPFVGKAGGKLNEGLVLAGLPRARCYVSNVAKCMTPSNVNPTQQCQRICTTTWLDDELYRLAQLKLIVTLGNEALHVFFKQLTVGEYHGLILPTWLGERNIDIFLSYHPSAALRSTLMNKHFMGDMTKLGQHLKKNRFVGTRR